MNPERRKAKRHALVQYLKVLDPDSQDLLGRVVDVSEGGMMLVGEKPYTTEAGPMRLRMMLPSYLDDAPEYVEFDAECRWTGPDVNQELHDGGFRFVSMTDDLKDTLDLVVEELSFERSIPDPDVEAEA